MGVNWQSVRNGCIAERVRARLPIQDPLPPREALRQLSSPSLQPVGSAGESRRSIRAEACNEYKYGLKIDGIILQSPLSVLATANACPTLIQSNSTTLGCTPCSSTHLFTCALIDFFEFVLIAESMSGNVMPRTL